MEANTAKSTEWNTSNTLEFLQYGDLFEIISLLFVFRVEWFNGFVNEKHFRTSAQYQIVTEREILRSFQVERDRLQA